MSTCKRTRPWRPQSPTRPTQTPETHPERSSRVAGVRIPNTPRLFDSRPDGLHSVLARRRPIPFAASVKPYPLRAGITATVITITFAAMAAVAAVTTGQHEDFAVAVVVGMCLAGIVTIWNPYSHVAGQRVERNR